LDERSSLGTVSKRGCFFRNARARNNHVEATLNHPFAAQVKELEDDEAFAAALRETSTLPPEDVPDKPVLTVDEWQRLMAAGWKCTSNPELNRMNFGREPTVDERADFDAWWPRPEDLPGARHGDDATDDEEGF
jgi:hypothetical protein